MAARRNFWKRSNKGSNPELDRKAKQKYGHSFVEIPDAPVGADRQAFVKLVVDQALKTVIDSLPQHQRQQYSGKVDPLIGNAMCSIPVVLHHQKAKIDVKGNINVPITVVDGGDGDVARKLGRELGRQLIDGLKKHQEEWRHEYESDDYEKQFESEQYQQPDVQKETVLPDCSEALAVARMLDETRCAACGYGDLDNADWDELCSHTQQERDGT